MKTELLTGEALRRQIHELFDVVASRCTSDEIVFLCPECDDHSGHRSASLSKGFTNCWKCNKGGTFVAWARRLGYSVDVSHSTQLPADLVGHVRQTLRGRPRFTGRCSVSVALPEEFTRLDSTVAGVNGHAHPVRYRCIAEMAIRKRLHVEDLISAGVGYTGIGKWEPYAIFPVYDWGRLVYYQGRVYSEDEQEGTPNKLFPSRLEVPLGAAYCVYNIDEVRREHVKCAIVVESILNVLSLQKKLEEVGVLETAAVCVFKHHISRFQALKIAKCTNLSEVCILFDHDATAHAWEQADVLSRGLFRKLRVTVAEMPATAGNPKADPNDDVDAAWIALSNRQIFKPSFVNTLRRKLVAVGQSPST